MYSSLFTPVDSQTIGTPDPLGVRDIPTVGSPTVGIQTRHNLVQDTGILWLV
jgi:hypothetical protein